MIDISDSDEKNATLDEERGSMVSYRVRKWNPERKAHKSYLVQVSDGVSLPGDLEPVCRG
jgi:hypothetical protein